MNGGENSDSFYVLPPPLPPHPHPLNNTHVSLPPLDFPPPPPMPWVQPPFQVPSFPPPSDLFSVPPPLPNLYCPPPNVFLPPAKSAQWPPPIETAHPQNEIDVWLQKWQEKRHALSSEHQKSLQPDYSIKISSAKTYLKECSSLIKELSRLSKYLSVLHKSLPQDDWNKRVEEINDKKRCLGDLLAKFEGRPEVLEKLKGFVCERKQRRARLKRRRGEWQKHVQEVKIHREREHKRIDLWLENMKDEVERAKREDDIRRQADNILSSVNSKKSQAKTMLTLFNTLTKLRNVRISKLQNSGQSISQVDVETFNEVIGKLKNLWLQQMREYNKEEECLKLMLNDKEAERSNVELSVAKKVLEEWTCLLFGGPSNPQYSPSSLEEFISLRREWDRFISCDSTPSPFSSRIPQGWVVPVAPSSSDWALLSTSHK